MIAFKCKDTERLSKGERVKEFQSFERTAQRKLRMLQAATKLSDLKAPPNNKLEALKDDRKGQHSIRINDQWRICFVWKDGHATDVEIVDYH
ncbi:MAG: type II toxin-antitoxin system RelE/ParE family toxin [Stellaceae bacterium]